VLIVKYALENPGNWVQKHTFTIVEAEQAPGATCTSQKLVATVLLDLQPFSTCSQDMDCCMLFCRGARIGATVISLQVTTSDAGIRLHA